MAGMGIVGPMLIRYALVYSPWRVVHEETDTVVGFDFA